MAKGTRQSKRNAEDPTPAKALAGKATSSYGPVRIKKIEPVLPKGEAKLQLLTNDLKHMEIEGLLELPWSVSSEDMLLELMGKPVPLELTGGK